MGFIDNLEEQRMGAKAGEEATTVRLRQALEALNGLLQEIRSCFGEDPKAHGIQVNDATFPVTGSGTPYHVPGLKVIFDPRRFIQIQPEGMAIGGFRVDIHFNGCPDNQSHTLLYALQEGGGEHVWAFLQKESSVPKLTRWSKEAFEEILDRQVIGRAYRVK